MNMAPGYVHIFSPTTVLSINPYYRLDNVKYSASPDPFSDQPITFEESRRLNNVGIKTDLSYVKGKHNAKFGVQISHTFLTEGFEFGITDPDFNDPASPAFLPGLLPFDLTRGGRPFVFHGHTDIKQEAFFAQDNITLGMRRSRWVCVSITITASRMTNCCNRAWVSLISSSAQTRSCVALTLAISKLPTTKT